MPEQIKPAIDSLASYKGDKTSANSEFVRLVTERNIQISMDDIRKRSPIIKAMERQGDIAIAGAVYDMSTGVIEFLE